jgi:OPA family glycerol-3-phosphate transporter-like MFS transporter
MIGFLRPAAFQHELPAERIDPEYRRLRRRVYAGIFVGYAGYYLVRNNLALAIPDLLVEHPEYSKAQLGTALTALSIAYGFSKFLMGSVSDRSNPKYFMPLGLLLSARRRRRTHGPVLRRRSIAPRPLRPALHSGTSGAASSART